MEVWQGKKASVFPEAGQPKVPLVDHSSSDNAHTLYISYLDLDGFAVPARRLNVVGRWLPYSPGDDDQIAVLTYNDTES
ncbi:MAG: hypothetical protein ACLQVF_16805 [Isosphaeraceae bacterium]